MCRLVVFAHVQKNDQGHHADAEQALRCLGLLLDGIRLPGIAARGLGSHQLCPGMEASIAPGLGSII